MKKTSKTIVFFGSGPLAAESLKLLANDFAIEAVITKPKPSHHRGDFPVIDVAGRLDLAVYTVANRAELSDLIDRKLFKSQVGVLIDFGIIVGQDAIDYFPLGIVNSHFSLLPQWRGADPISFSVLSGDKQTGVSLMLLVEAMDQGPLLDQQKISPAEDITTPQLTDQLMHLSHKMLRDCLPKYLSGQLKAYPQATDNLKPTYSRRLNKSDGLIDWSKSAEQIERQIRAFIDWPKSRTSLGGKEVIITKARTKQEARNTKHEFKPGTPIITPDKQLAVRTGSGLLIIDRLKPAGKQEMSAQAFLQGYKLTANS